MLKPSLELKGTKLRGLGGQSNLLMRVIIASVRPLTLTFTMRRNLPKLSSVLISHINLLNFSLKNISKNVKNLVFVYFY